MHNVPRTSVRTVRDPDRNFKEEREKIHSYIESEFEQGNQGPTYNAENNTGKHSFYFTLFIFSK